MNSCKDNCKHSILCETWGNYKCTLKKRRYESPLENCGSYEKSTDKAVKVCQCEECNSRDPEELGRE